MLINIYIKKLKSNILKVSIITIITFRISFLYSIHIPIFNLNRRISIITIFYLRRHLKHFQFLVFISKRFLELRSGKS